MLFLMETEVKFTEKLNRLTCATLLVETAKYLLFHRFQTPLPFDQIKAEDERDRKLENARRSPRNRPLPSVLKKKRQLIADAEELWLNLYHAFLNFDVFDVLLLFGATVVNPKEMYSIKFCNLEKTSELDRVQAECSSGKENSLSLRSKFVDKCCRKLARMLFTDPGLNDQGELGCTTIHCLILAPRNLDTTWFRPKPSFKVPKKGKPCEIRIYGGDNGHLGTLEDNDGHMRACEGNEETLEEINGEQDTLWFQAPVVIKGYKEAYKETLESSMWKK